MNATDYINKLRSQGRFSFSIEEAQQVLGLEKIPCLNALHRLREHKLLASPARGFYLIVPPEYQVYGCLPAEMFVPDLMRYWHLPYYTAFLSAAQYYGAAHQKPQRFQVMTIKNRPSVQCGRILVEFIANKWMTNFPVNKFNTVAGTVNVASPEVLAADLVTSPQHAAGINNVATILLELAEALDGKKLVELTQINNQLVWIQRLGWLLDFLGFEELSTPLWHTLENKKFHWMRLLSKGAYNPIERNKKWRIIINTTVEPDE